MNKSYLRVLARTACLQAAGVALMAAALLVPDARAIDFFQAVLLIITTGLVIMAMLLPAPNTNSIKRNLTEGVKDAGRLVVAPLRGAVEGTKTIWQAEREPVKR